MIVLSWNESLVYKFFYRQTCTEKRPRSRGICFHSSMRDAMRRRSSIDAVGRSDPWIDGPSPLSFAESRRASVAMVTVTVTVPRTVPWTVTVRGRPSASRRARRDEGEW